MAKGKKRKKKTVDVKSQETITIFVPNAIADLDKKVLHAIGRLTAAAASTFDIDDVAIVKTSQLAAPIEVPLYWHKHIPDA